MRQAQRPRGCRAQLLGQPGADAIDLLVLVHHVQQVRVHREVGQVKRRQGEQPQRAVGALLLSPAPRARRPMRDARGICSTQTRRIRRRGPRHRLSHVHLNAPLLIAHPAGTGRPPETPARGSTPLTPARHLRQAFDPPGDDRETASATARQLVRSLEVIYRDLARPWPLDELAASYHAAYERGASDMPADETSPDRPITLLATAIPRLISLAVAANVLHIRARFGSSPHIAQRKADLDSRTDSAKPIAGLAASELTRRERIVAIGILRSKGGAEAKALAPGMRGFRATHVGRSVVRRSRRGANEVSDDPNPTSA